MGKKNKLLANITPGEVLWEDFLKPMGISQYRLAKEIAVPIRRITEIVVMTAGRQRPDLRQHGVSGHRYPLTPLHGQAYGFRHFGGKGDGDAFNAAHEYEVIILSAAPRTA